MLRPQPIQTLRVSEDRDLFVKALNGRRIYSQRCTRTHELTETLIEIDIPAAQSTAVSTVADALSAAAKIGYPVILRSAYSLGGLGSGFAHDEDELRDLSAKSLSLSPQVLIEKSLKGWRELEYEVVRDANDNCITVCNMEVGYWVPRQRKCTCVADIVLSRTSTLLERTLVTRSSLRLRRPSPTMNTTCCDRRPSRSSG
jgi:biotin carboxylase